MADKQDSERTVPSCHHLLKVLMKVCPVGEAMPSGSVKLKDNSFKKRNRYYWNTSWSKSLKEISCLLPVSEPASGQTLSKKETLIHMLQYFDFLQTHIQRLLSNLPPHCLPETNDRESDSESEDTAHSEPSTPPRILKAKRKYSCGRPRKKHTQNAELFDGKTLTLHEEDADRNVTPVTKPESPCTPAADETVSSAEDNSSLPCSSDSNYSVSALLPTTSSSTAGSTVDQESPCQGLGSQCSICDDRTGSEYGSQGSKELASPSSGSFILKDQMFGVLSPLGKNQLDDSPSLPQTPVLPFLPLLGFQEGLNLSPSLLTSPARDLGHTLLPEGQEELQLLFEDVWVTPKSAAPKYCRHGNDGHAFSQSEEEDKRSDDITWTPNQRLHVKKGGKVHRKRASRKGQAVSGPNQKKKCVNGFIMFCRLNRRLYLRTHPGLPSTVVTKELANLWHIMPKQERRVYCLKARQFSRQHNRNVRSEGQEAEEEEKGCVPSPLHMLLAHKDLWFSSNGKA